MSWILRVLAAVIVALLLALGLQPSLAASAPADSDVVHGYVYDAHVIPDVVANGAPERGPPANLTSCTSAPAVDPGSHGRFARQDGGTPAVIYAYDCITHLAQAGDSSSPGAGIVPGFSGEPSALTLAGVAANTGPRMLGVGPWGQRVVDARTKLPGSWGPGVPNKKGVGTRWFDPSNPGNGVRIDQGLPGSPQLSQQVDHVVVRSGGRVIGPDGKPIVGSLSDNPQAHIPLTDWMSWSSWSAP